MLNEEIWNIGYTFQGRDYPHRWWLCKVSIYDVAKVKAFLAAVWIKICGVHLGDIWLKSVLSAHHRTDSNTSMLQSQLENGKCCEANKLY